jgi:SPP1 family predicted phage head-tail adaptor
MDAGKRDQQIVIQHLTRASDLAGGWTETWATLATCWAAVRTKTAREGMDEGRMNATAVNAFTILHDDAPTVAENDRISWNGAYWNIRTVFRSGTRVQTVQLDAERGVNGG